MKHSLAILLFVLSVLSMKAQLAPVGTKWTFGSTDQQDKKFVFRATIEKDTLIDSITYSLISSWQQNYITIQNDKIYYYFQSKKCVFFDFNVKQKDTILVDLHLIYNDTKDTLIQQYPIRIDSIYYWKFSNSDSVLSYTFTGLISLQSLGLFLSFETRTINSKVIFGPFYHSFAFGFSTCLIQRREPEWVNYFQCYEEPNGYTIKANPTIDCAKVGIEEIRNYEKLISVYPNPSSGSFQIELKNNINPTQLFIYDAKGDLVERKCLNHNSTSFQFDAKQKSGQYYFVFELENNVRVVKSIMIE